MVTMVRPITVSDRPTACARGTVTTFVMPHELIEALDADPELAEAFPALTHGRHKSYVINLNAAKKPETRVARIVKFRNHIMSGKGALERRCPI